LTWIRRYLRRIRLSKEARAALSRLPPKERELILRIRSERLTYLSERKLASLAHICRQIEESDLPGVFLEAGCALGGSAILLATLKRPARPLRIYDVFGMIPPPSEKDTQEVQARYQTIARGESSGIGGDKYYGYQENLDVVVRNNLMRFGVDCCRLSVSLIKGLVQDTMEMDQPVALAHIDVDWYDPVMTSLERTFPNLVVGGSIIIDDYYDWGGCRQATEEYLERVAGQFARDDSSGSVKLTKLSKQRSGAA
jgi:Macrocin-O-methyltransferase (TylF)